MEKTLLKKYSALREKMKNLEAEELLLKAEIMQDMDKNKLEKVESEYGNFTIGHRKNWKYSEKVTDLEERVKIQKFKEQEKGVAVSVETPYLVFKQNQNE